jgi:hypothetical protein
MEVKLVLEEFQDYLARRLDTYEQAIYLYIFRHTRLAGSTEATIGFKSARLRLAQSIGLKGGHMSEGICYEKLRSLKEKGCLEILGTERNGTRVKVFLPSEIPGVVPQSEAVTALSLEEMDFFAIPQNRALILRREDSRCFYCLRTLTPANHVIEHVQSRPSGTNGYRNVVAACLACNNRKGDTLADDFLRQIYRDELLNADEFEQRLAALQALRNGLLRPTL